MAKKTKAELLNEIDRLRDEMHASSDVIDEKVKEIKELRADYDNRQAVINENAKEISKLDKAVAELGRLIGEKDNEIKLLREQAVVDAETVREKAKEIKTFELVCGAKANKIKDLEGALKIVRHLRSENVHENGQLQQEVATLRDYSDKQADVIRHYVSRIADLEQAENSQCFRRLDHD